MFIIERTLKQPSAGGASSGWDAPPVFASLSRFLCLPPPCARWACQQRQREICDVNLGLDVVYCRVYSSVIAFPSLLCYWQLGGLKASLSKWNLFFFYSSPFCFVLFCLPQTHGHLAYAVVFSVRKVPESKQSPADTHGQSRAAGGQLSQSAGHWVRHSGQTVSLTEPTVGTVDPVTYRHRKEV